jgi:hypothetical protein
MRQAINTKPGAGNQMGRGKPTKKSGSRPRKKKGDDGNDD